MIHYNIRHGPVYIEISSIESILLWKCSNFPLIFETSYPSYHNNYNNPCVNQWSINAQLIVLLKKDFQEIKGFQYL